MSVYRRRVGGAYHVEVEWKGFPRLRLSTRTTIRARAVAMERTLHALLGAGRADIIGLLAKGRLGLAEVHEAYLRDPSSLEHRIKEAGSPVLGPLVEEWLNWLASPAALSPKTKRPYAPRTAYRYGESWARLFALLLRGRDSSLSDLTRGFLSDYRSQRRKAGVKGSTVNRDMVALAAFLRWGEEERGLPIVRPKMPREREGTGRERWLSADELRSLENALPARWRPLFALLVYTGARIGEAQGLLWGDVRLAERRIILSEGARRLKNLGSARILPVPERLAQLLASHAAMVPTGPADPVFPGPLGNYVRAIKAFRRACQTAGLTGLVPHDLRHTFAVHAIQNGVPLPRLQKLLGHATPAMVMRYAAHAPEAYLDEDAARVAASLSGCGDKEAESRAQLAQRALRPA
jgi:integrase